MPPEIFALMDKPLLLLTVLMAGAALAMLCELALSALSNKQATGEARRRPFRPRANTIRRGPWGWRPEAVPARDAADQLRIVMGAAFAIQPLLNKGETRLFKELDRIVLACNPDWQVMAQVSLGEVLRSVDPAAYSCINSKRVDLLLVDENCMPRHAIEYQGHGHHQGTAAARDAVKKEALRRAGIGYHEVVAGHTTPADLRSLVERLVEKPKIKADT